MSDRNDWRDDGLIATQETSAADRAIAAGHEAGHAVVRLGVDLRATSESFPKRHQSPDKMSRVWMNPRRPASA
jgi:hypothetical protein